MTGFVTAVAFTGALATVMPISASRAAETPPTAAERAFATFEAGEVAFRAADFVRAARLFGEAFEVHAEPAYAFNRGLALARGNKLAEAEAAFLALIEQFPDNARLDEVREQLEEVRAARRQQEVVIAVTSVPSGAMARIMGGGNVELVCTTPCELRTEPGELVVEVATQTARTERKRKLGPGTRWDLTVDLMPKVDGGLGPNEIGAVTLWSIGGAGLATGVALGLIAMNARDDAAALASDSPLSDPDFQRFQRSKSQARDFALGADIGFGVAAAGAIVGTVLWLVGDDPAVEAPTNGGIAWRF